MAGDNVAGDELQELPEVHCQLPGRVAEAPSHHREHQDEQTSRGYLQLSHHSRFSLHRLLADEQGALESPTRSLPRPESHLCCWLQEPRDVPRVVAEAVHPVHAGPGAGHPRPPGLLSGLHPRSHGPLAPTVHQQSDTKCTTDSISW